VFLEGAARRPPVDLRIAAQLREQCEQFFAGRICHTCQADLTGVEAFRGSPFGIDHFVFVKHHVDVGDKPTFLARDRFVVDQMRGGHKHFAFTEQQLRAIPLEQHAVLRRDQKITLKPRHSARTQTHRGEFVRCRHRALLDPRDIGARGEADDLFDPGEAQQRAIVKCHSA